MRPLLRPLTRSLRVVLLGALLFAACSKSVEGETQRWATNSAKVTELAAVYPGFKPAIDARKAAATPLYDAAAALEGDAKIAKLAEANDALMRGFVGDLAALDAKIKALRERRVEAAAQAGDDSTRLAAKVAAEDAGQAIDRAEAALKAGAADEAAAAAILKKLHADLDTAKSAIDKVIAADQAKKDDAAKAKDEVAADAAAKAAADAAEAAKLAPWKCGHCDSQNTHEHTSCQSCGAARPEAAPAK